MSVHLQDVQYLVITNLCQKFKEHIAYGIYISNPLISIPDSIGLTSPVHMINGYDMYVIYQYITLNFDHVYVWIL